MTRLEVKRHMGRGDIEAVSELLELAAAADGHAPLGEHRWLDLVHGGRQSFAGLVAWESGHDHPVGFAQLSRGETNEEHLETWELEYIVDPHHRGTEPSIDQTLLNAAIQAIGTEGGGHLHLWVPKPTQEHFALAQAAGLRPGRELHQLRLLLPTEEQPTKEQPTEEQPTLEAGTLEVRPFVPGQDEAAWLEVNNRAFSWHPEQGGWDMATLRSREREPWFDPSGFLLHERDGKLVGFCWTKVHHDRQTPIGEIYVLAVDPSTQQKGLGRALTRAGLDWLTRQGLKVAVLYVDAHNAPAMRLYLSLGFSLDHVDQAFVGDVKPLTTRPAL